MFFVVVQTTRNQMRREKTADKHVRDVLRYAEEFVWEYLWEEANRLVDVRNQRNKTVSI